MFFAMVVMLALAAQPKSLEVHLDELDADLIEVRRILESGITDQTTAPEPGILVYSAENPGADGFHAVTVVGVFGGSPADTAGVRVGDRIIMIGNRRLEHEPASVVHALMKGSTDPFLLLVERKGVVVTRVGIKMQPRVLPCRAEGVRLVGKRWLPGVAVLEASASELRKALALNPGYQSTRQKVAEKLVELDELLVEFYESLENQIVDTTLETCSVRFQ